MIESLRRARFLDWKKLEMLRFSQVLYACQQKLHCSETLN